MARWKAGHSLMALQLIGRMVGVSEEEIRTAWLKDEREQIIGKAIQR
jgi:hypothetical protein